MCKCAVRAYLIRVIIIIPQKFKSFRPTEFAWLNGTAYILYWSTHFINQFFFVAWQSGLHKLTFQPITKAIFFEIWIDIWHGMAWHYTNTSIVYYQFIMRPLLKTPQTYFQRIGPFMNVHQLWLKVNTFHHLTGEVQYVFLLKGASKAWYLHIQHLI